MTDPRPGTLTWIDDGAARVITIDNPARKNALSPAMLRALPDLLGAAQRTDGVRAVVLRGVDGSGFSSGFDLTELRGGADPVEVDAVLRGAMEAVTGCSLPVIAAVDGWCVGAALELALTCDLRVCTPGSYFRLPAAALGITYPRHGLARIAAVVGAPNAMRITLLGERIDATSAQRWGMVHAVSEDALSTAAEWAGRIAAADSAALAAMKRTLVGLAGARDVIEGGGA